MLARHDPELYKREADLDELVNLDCGLANLGFGSGETGLVAHFYDRERRCVKIPTGAQVRRFWRTYSIKITDNPNHRTDVEFPVSLVQDPYPKSLELIDSKGRDVDLCNFSRYAKFKVIPQI